MLLFFSPVFNPVFNLLTKSQHQAKLVYWGVELIPAVDKNKSLQLAGDFHYKILSYIKFHIDAVIAEMETAEVPAPTPQVEDTIKETAPESITEPIAEPQPEAAIETLKAKMLACKCKQELDTLKSEIGAEKASELWDSLTILERNHIKNVKLCKSPEKRIYGIGTRLQYTDKDGKRHNAKGIGHYLHGEALKDDERAILINGELKPIAVKRSQIKPFDDKAQKPLEPGEFEILQNFLTQPQPKPEIEPDFEPTPEQIAALNFTGLESSPKFQATGNSGSQPDSQASSASEVEPGDLIEVHDPESALNGKIVEIAYLIKNGKGAVCVMYDDRSYCIPKDGYSIFQKNLLSSPKA